MIKKTLFTIVALAFIWTAKSQETGEDKLGSWFMVFAKHQVSEKFSIHSEIQYRTYEFGNNFNQLLLRFGLNYHFSKNATTTIGYGYIPTDVTFEKINGEENSIEHRIYEELSINNALGKFELNHRYRLEQRFLDSPGGAKETQHRVRYLFRITYPINENWFLTAYDEVFLNLQEPIFGQNRLYGAIGYKFSKNISTQVGYLKNHFTGVNYDRFQLGVWINTDFTKKKENKL
ncbi:MAG: DUF2490 domain-containing protein [Flavobacteriaceae bacterium]